MKTAFTLVETLLVLGVLALILSIYQIPQYKQLGQEIEGRQFFDILVQKLHHTKEKAMLENTTYLVSFNGTEDYIVFTQLRAERLDYLLWVPDFWDLESTFQIRYYGDGRADSFQTVTFLHEFKEEQVDLVFQLGSGIFDLIRHK